MTSHSVTEAGRHLRLEEYFFGHTRAWGMFLDRFGKVRRQFEIDAEGRWDGEMLTLVEDFTYDDGETERRTWRIKKTADDGYAGEAPGVIGVAEGTTRGNMLSWTYRFALDVGARRWTVRFEDRLFLQGDGLLINRANVTKFGLLLGEVVCVFRKTSYAPRREHLERTPCPAMQVAAGR